jgi:hypothetical protein
MSPTARPLGGRRSIALTAARVALSGHAAASGGPTPAPRPLRHRQADPEAQRPAVPPSAAIAARRADRRLVFHSRTVFRHVTTVGSQTAVESVRSALAAGVPFSLAARRDDILPFVWRKDPDRAGIPLQQSTPVEAAPLAATATASADRAGPAEKQRSSPARTAVPRAGLPMVLDAATTNRIADDVIRRIQQRARVERERRGI